MTALEIYQQAFLYFQNKEYKQPGDHWSFTLAHLHRNKEHLKAKPWNNNHPYRSERALVMAFLVCYAVEANENLLRLFCLLSDADQVQVILMGQYPDER
jgi:hypothetical protein